MGPIQSLQLARADNSFVAARLTLPYRTFDGWSPARTRLPLKSPDGTASFEPSAVASYVDVRSGDEFVVVLNDFYDPTQYRYWLNPKGELVPARTQARAVMQRDQGSAPFYPKFEAVSRLPDGRFLATTPFNRPGAQHREVFLFGPADGKKPSAKSVAFDAAGFERYVHEQSGQPWFQVEGLAVDAEAKHVFFGIRFVGQSREGKKRAEVMLVRCPFDGASIGAPETTLRFSTQRVLGRHEGLADIQRDPRDGSYLLLTSHEGPDVADQANNQGHLFRLPKEWVEGGPRRTLRQLSPPLQSFAAKSEGVTTLRDGRILVIFDDDREWKDNFVGYRRDQGAYVVLSPDGQPT